MKRYSVFDLYYEANRDGANIEVIKADEVDAEVSKLLRIIYRQYEELGRYDDEVEKVIDKYKKEG